MSVIPINTWYRFSGDGTAVTESSGAITIGAQRGVIQQLSNLSVNTGYTLTIDVGTYASTLEFQQYTGTVLQGTFPITSSGISFISFTAQSTSDTILIYSTATNVINSMSVVTRSIQPAGNTTYLGTDGQVICDLYEDEDIPLTLSIDEFKNVAEQVQSYSKAFNLPGTKRNNKIFDNLFEITRADDGVIFNPYVKTQCKLKQDGFILFEGYLRMIDIQDKQGEISYNVNLYSEVIALADVLGDKKFADLDFDELDHEYNKTQIKYSWNDAPNTGITYLNPNTSGFRDANSTVKYPFVNWNNGWIIANNPGGSSGPTDGFPQLKTLEQAFRPFINIKYLIDRIFNQDDVPFTYESTFFDTDDFNKLYMDFNWGSDNFPTQLETNTFNAYYFYLLGDGSAANYATTAFDVMNLSYNVPLLGGLTPPNYDDATNIITSTAVNENYNIQYIYNVENTDTVDRTIECLWLYDTTPLNYSGVITIPPGGLYTYTGTVSVLMTGIGETLQVQFRTNSGTANKVRQLQNSFPLSGASVVFNVGIAAATSSTFLQTARGEVGQWDFLKGIMTMFNLVSIPEKNNPNHIKIETYNDIFLENSDSKQWNWTDKIDVEEMKLEPLTDLKKHTIFKFVEDDDDFAFQNYKLQVEGHLYGSQKWDASTNFSGQKTIFIDEEEIVAEPFAATVVKPLLDFQFSDFIVPAIYSYNPDDGTSEGFDNSPRIMYNNGKKTLTTCTYYIPAQNGLSSENQSSFLQFSHLTDIPTITSSPPASTDTRDFHFGVCQLIPPINDSTFNNLFYLYWFAYIKELYDGNTRIMTIKVNLTPGDISTFRFYDTVIIKNREFRVNKIDYKPNDLATIEFILIP
jgi:hypothetical protein